LLWGLVSKTSLHGKMLSEKGQGRRGHLFQGKLRKKSKKVENFPDVNA